MIYDDETRWRAVEARDAKSDGAFVFGVSSTGIYCKPSCPSRRPRRENVSFFSTPVDAERAGFRSCRRCRPKAPDAGVAVVERACRLLDAADEGVLPLADLADGVGVDASRLHRAFKRVLGITPRQYAEARRIDRFKRHVKRGGGVTGALYEAGYGSSSRLYERSDERLGMTPDRYRRGGRGMRISYTIADCPLGRLLVAATERGLAAVTLGDDDAALETALRAEYPAAEVARADGGSLGAWVTAIVEHIEGARPHLELPLDLQATAFQARVWEELRRIPYGETRTYADVARAIGRPSATRAVARACATNPVALVTPCHRVVRSDGDPSGYRWGVERKRALQASERAASARQHVGEEA